MTWDGRERRKAERRAFRRPGGRRIGDPPAEWVNVTEYAQRFSLSRGTVYKWIKAGLLETCGYDAVVRVRNLPPKKSGSVCMGVQG